MLNLATELYDEDFEIMEGEKFMSPSPHRTHMYVMMNLAVKFHVYLAKTDKGRVFTDNMDIHFPDGNLMKPDLSIVCNPEYLKHGATVYGVPDFVAEILSRSTMRRDLTIKKDLYERNGVKEYWIIDAWSKNVQVNILKDGKYFLDGIYSVYDEFEWAELTDKEKAEVKFDIPVSIFDDLTINVNEIFYKIED